jgi:UDP-glucose 4-epimerase
MVVSNVMRTALVTGGAGFLGTAVVRTLEREGVEVVVAGTGTVADPLTSARIAAALVNVPEIVVHCAGTSSVAASVADPAGERAKTVAPFAELLEQLRLRAPEARVVLLSSAAVYGNAALVPTPEMAALAPLSPYGEDKRECEELCRAHGSAGHAAAIVRLFSVYGNGLRKQLLWDACCKARSGNPAFAGTGAEQRDWLHVTDAAALILVVAARASRAVPVVNGGAGHGVAVRDVVGQVCRELGASEPRFSGEVRVGDPQRYVADITRARGLGWVPEVELQRGITDYVTWFRALA